MSLIKHYDTAIAAGRIVNDPNQREIVLQLDSLAQWLSKPRKRWFIRPRHQAMRGIYLHGPVGVGKTFLMDLLFENTEIKQKTRLHFHQFMQQVDTQLRQLQGQADPLRQIARLWANKVRLLCFDEFMVRDVAHAMILKELLEALFAEGVVFFITSNIPPDELYLNGIHRARFLPAIDLIKSRCQVINLGSSCDYRLGYAAQMDRYISPLNEENEQRLLNQFMHLEPHSSTDGVIRVQNRNIAYIRRGEGAIWFDFKVLCNLPRSQLDYLEIADRFDTVFLSNIPVIGEEDTLFAILLIQLIDVFYDKRIQLVMSAAVPINQLYERGEMRQAFKRTASRLQEMQSVRYTQSD